MDDVGQPPVVDDDFGDPRNPGSWVFLGCAAVFTFVANAVSVVFVGWHAAINVFVAAMCIYLAIHSFRQARALRR